MGSTQRQRDFNPRNRNRDRGRGRGREWCPGGGGGAGGRCDYLRRGVRLDQWAGVGDYLTVAGLLSVSRGAALLERGGPFCRFLAVLRGRRGRSGGGGGQGRYTRKPQVFIFQPFITRETLSTLHALRAHINVHAVRRAASRLRPRAAWRGARRCARRRRGRAACRRCSGCARPGARRRASG